MLSIGSFAKTAQVSTRTIRYYESIGLLPKSTRRENGYRHYDQKYLGRMTRIRDLQSLGFRLEDIKHLLDFSETELAAHLQKRLLEIDREAENLKERRERVKSLLSVAQKIETGESLTTTERNFFLEDIKDEVIKGLELQSKKEISSAMTYLNREAMRFEEIA